MTVVQLAHMVYALFVTYVAAGESYKSLEELHDCTRAHDGTVTCEGYVPECKNERDLKCRFPKWSESRNAYVIMERREAALDRYAKVSYALARAASRLITCHEGDSEIAGCVPLQGWTERSLVAAMMSVTFWESGLHEDIVSGRKRGTRGEICAMQLMPRYLPTVDVWHDNDANVSPTELVGELTGLNDEALYKCFLAGGTMLNKAMGAARGCHSGDLFYSAYVMYGTGHLCSLKGLVKTDWARRRTNTYYLYMYSQVPELDKQDESHFENHVASLGVDGLIVQHVLQ